MKTIRNVTVKLTNNKNVVYALHKPDTQKIKLKKYEMSESHTSPFLVYIKDKKRFVTPIGKSFDTQMENDHILDTNQ
tara:strand:+ start:333 stop:563 length:231 start_codon:yes stop_codon:yes gene_type:complete